MSDQDPAHEMLAARYLSHPLRVRNISRHVFPRGPATRDEIVTTNRLILVLSGKLRYTIDGRSYDMRKGVQFFVPAWVRRVWSVPRGGPCEVCWCEFDEVGNAASSSGLLRRMLVGPAFVSEQRCYGRMSARFRSSRARKSVWDSLRLESELKAMLVRFLESADRALPRAEPVRAVHPAVMTVLQLLSTRFSEPGILAEAYRQSAMSRNYFRLLFSAATQSSPQAYIEMLRMRRARYLLHETDWQIKKVASEVGYQDPLFFSRRYRRFWRRTPSAERADGGGGPE